MAFSHEDLKVYLVFEYSTRGQGIDKARDKARDKERNTRKAQMGQITNMMEHMQSTIYNLKSEIP